MARKSGQYSNVVFTSNKTLDKSLEIDNNKDIENNKKEFLPTVKAYVHYFNEELKKYEMFTILIDPISGETKLERKPIDNIDNEPRAIMEMQKLYSKDYMDKLKKR